MNVAIEVQRIVGWKGDARLYHLDPPMADEDGDTHEYVVVSGVFAPFSGPETYIFPATEDGEVVSFGEMNGSFRGGIDHAAALAGAGYTIVTPIES